MTPDRKNQPSIRRAAIPPLVNPDIVRLDNGVPLYMIHSGDNDILRIDFVFNAGQVYEKNVLAASTVNMMLSEGSNSLNANEINNLLDFYGSVPNFFCEKDSAGLSIAFLGRYSKEILGLCRQIIFEPSFPAEEFEALMNKRVQWYDLRQERVQSVANDRFFESVFGTDHPYGRFALRDDFLKLTRDDLFGFHDACYKTSNLALIASGNLTAENISVINSTIGQVNQPGGKNLIKHGLNRFTPVSKGKFRKKGALQSAIRIGSRTINKRDPDYPALKITDTILGGYFGSRLMKNIREDKGYTYGIQSYVSSLDLSGYFLISTEVGSKYTSKSIKEIYREIKRLREEPVSSEELEVVKNYMAGEMVRMFDGPFSSADSFRSVWEFGMDYKYFNTLSAMINNITAGDIIRVADTYFREEDLVEIVAGP